MRAMVIVLGLWSLVPRVEVMGVKVGRTRPTWSHR